MIDIGLIGLKGSRTSSSDAREDRAREARDFGDEFASWQTDDVHRKHADVRHTRSGVRTTFRPHSRYEMMRRRRSARRLIRRGRYVPRWSTRPILRQQLLDELYERIVKMLHEKFKW